MNLVVVEQLTEFFISQELDFCMGNDSLQECGVLWGNDLESDVVDLLDLQEGFCGR